MILADTSVWIDHLRKGDPVLDGLLNNGQVLTHPFVICELALGVLRQRKIVMNALQNLPQATIATNDEVLGMIDSWGLHGDGIGYVDAHLLAAVALTPGTVLWTRDKRLRTTAGRLRFDSGLN